MSHDPAEFQLASESPAAPENGQPGALRSGDWLGGLDATCEDCMGLMRRYPDGHFDLAIVDPPYGIGECTCVHWMCRVGPFIKNKGSTWEDHRAACYHVIKARNHLIRGVLMDFAKQEMAR